MKKMMKKIINVCLIGMLSLILMMGCIGCSNKANTPAVKEESKVYDYYSSMTKVHQLNWVDFYSDFAYIEDKEEPKNSHWIFKICPQFIANGADYNWVYYGDSIQAALDDVGCQDIEEAVEKEILPTYKNKLIF